MIDTAGHGGRRGTERDQIAGPDQAPDAFRSSEWTGAAPHSRR
jgi:hypothetical protein